jgi:hypothetical protein
MPHLKGQIHGTGPCAFASALRIGRKDVGNPAIVVLAQIQRFLEITEELLKNNVKFINLLEKS